MTFFISIAIWVIFVTVGTIPNGISILHEPTHPWYTPYTSKLFLMFAFIFYPVTMLAQFLKIKLLGGYYFTIALIYIIVVMDIVKLIFKPRKKSANNK